MAHTRTPPLRIIALLFLCFFGGFVTGKFFMHSGAMHKRSHSLLSVSEKTTMNRRLQAIQQAIARNQKEYEFLIATPVHLR